MTLTRVQSQTLRRGVTSLAANIDGLINSVDGMVYNIKSTDFAGGAKCDGVTDDTDAIQACWDAIATAGRGIAIHPPGISIVTLRSASRAYCLRPRSGVRVWGYGNTIQLADFSSGNASGTRAIGADSSLGAQDAFQMYGITVDNNKDNQVHTIDTVVSGSITAAGVLSGGQATNTGTITVDSTTGYDSAGSLNIQSVSVTYTSVNATQFLGCTGGSATVQADLTPVYQSPAKMTVNSPALFSTNNLYQIGLELVRPSSIVGSILTVSRIQDGTGFSTITVGEAIETGFSYDQDMACYLGSNAYTRTVIMACTFRNARSDGLNVASHNGPRVIGNEMSGCNRVGLNFKQSDHAILVANWIHDNDGYAMRSEDDSSGFVQRGNRIIANEITGTGVGGGITMTQGAGTITDTVIAQNYMDLQNPAVSVYGVNYEGSHLDVVDNDFVNCAIPVIRLSRTTVKFSIRGNRIRPSVDTASIGAGAIAIGGGSGVPASDGAIEDNWVEGSPNSGIVLSGTSGGSGGVPLRVQIKRNRVVSCGFSGITVFAGTDCDVDDNFLYNNGTNLSATDQAGIRTSSFGGTPPSRLSIRRNRFLGTGNQITGIRIAAAATPDATIEGNLIANSTAAAIALSSNLSGSVLVQNNRGLGTTPAPIPVLGVSLLPAVQLNNASALYSVSGVPSTALGVDGDFAFRQDGTVVGSTVQYHKEAGAWVPLTST